METTQKPKRGRPYDAEARGIAMRLRRTIDASPYTIADLARHAGMSESERSATTKALRGERAARRLVASIGDALADLTLAESSSTPPQDQ